LTTVFDYSLGEVVLKLRKGKYVPKIDMETPFPCPEGTPMFGPEWPLESVYGSLFQSWDQDLLAKCPTWVGITMEGHIFSILSLNPTAYAHLKVLESILNTKMGEKMIDLAIMEEYLDLPLDQQEQIAKEWNQRIRTELKVDACRIESDEASQAWLIRLLTAIIAQCA
jgi:hypothetical protein